MSVAILQSTYSPGVGGITVVSAGATTYCVSANVGDSAWYKAGPSGQITKTACS
jgi:hypothetical protein